LKLTTDKHEASRGLSATAELLVVRRHSIALLLFSIIFVAVLVCLRFDHTPLIAVVAVVVV